MGGSEYCFSLLHWGPLIKINQSGLDSCVRCPCNCNMVLVCSCHACFQCPSQLYLLSGICVAGVHIASSLHAFVSISRYDSYSLSHMPDLAEYISRYIANATSSLMLC